MKISTFFYTIGQGFRNLFRNKWYSLASIATITACLFMFGVFYAVVVNVQHVVRVLEEEICVTVFFEEGLADERIEEIGRLIAGRAEVSDIEFISVDEAWEQYQETYFGDRAEEFAAAFPRNPLWKDANYVVYLNDVSQQADLVTYVESLTGVREVNRADILAEMLTGGNLLIGYVAVGIILILLAVSIFLISNTIAVGISVRKEEINIMKYIGATDFFVRAPFVLEGILIGGIGALLPLYVVHELYAAVLLYVSESFSALTRRVSFVSGDLIFDFLIPVSLCVGVGVGLLGSYVTVRKHLHV